MIAAIVYHSCQSSCEKIFKVRWKSQEMPHCTCRSFSALVQSCLWTPTHHVKSRIPLCRIHGDPARNSSGANSRTLPGLVQQSRHHHGRPRGMQHESSQAQPLQVACQIIQDVINIHFTVMTPASICNLIQDEWCFLGTLSSVIAISA